MSLVMQKTEMNTTTTLYKELYAIPQYAADAVREEFLNMSKVQYIGWLKMMYHYTLNSEQKGKGAAAISPTVELQELFNQMAKEERGHYLLASEDLKELGHPIDAAAPTPLPVHRYNEWWDSLYPKGDEGAYSFLGALFVFENIAQYLAQDAMTGINKLDLNKKQTRWIRIHAEADIEHGNLLESVVESYFSENAEVILHAAKEASDLWININKAPLT